MPKFAVLSQVLPPSPSGQAMVLYRILRDLDPTAYCLISRQDYAACFGTQDANSRLPARYYHVSQGRLPTLNLPVIRTVRALANSLFQLIQRAVGAARIVRRENCRAIVACTADPFDLPAAYLVGRWLGIPFYAYIFDDYVYQWPTPDRRLFAKLAAPAVMRGATAVIVPNEFLGDAYRRRYGIEPLVIHNPCELVEPGNADPWPSEPNEIKIVYTGAIYGAQDDAFHNLLSALKILGRPDLKLHIYTEQTWTELEQMGIVGSIVYHGYLTRSEALTVQHRADILFLPLAFHGEEIVRTAAPGKMGEYLASGRPVLAHVPGDSFVAWYFRTYQVGTLVDHPDPATLAQAIRQLLDEPALRQTWCENAVERARADFSPEVARARFLGLLQGEKRPGPGGASLGLAEAGQ